MKKEFNNITCKRQDKLGKGQKVLFGHSHHSQIRLRLFPPKL